MIYAFITEPLFTVPFCLPRVLNQLEDMDAPPEPPGSNEAAAVAPPTPPTVLPSGDGPEQLTKTPPAPDSTEGPQTTPESNGKGKAGKKPRVGN